MKNKHLFNMKDLSLKTILTLIVLVSFNVIQAQNKNQEAFKNIKYRNLFKEAGYKKDAINKKLSKAY